MQAPGKRCVAGKLTGPSLSLLGYCPTIHHYPGPTTLAQPPWPKNRMNYLGELEDEPR